MSLLSSEKSPNSRQSSGSTCLRIDSLVVGKAACDKDAPWVKNVIGVGNIEQGDACVGADARFDVDARFGGSSGVEAVARFDVVA